MNPARRNHLFPFIINNGKQIFAADVGAEDRDNGFWRWETGEHITLGWKRGKGTAEEAEGEGVISGQSARVREGGAGSG